MRKSRIKLVDERNQKARSFLIAFYFLYTYIEPYLNNTLGSIGKYLIFIIIIGLIVFSKRFYFKSYHFALIGWLLYRFSTLFWTTDYTAFEMHYLSYIGSIALLLFMTAMEDSENCYRVALKSIWIGSAIIGFLSLFLSKNFEGQSNRQVLTLFNYQNDPNNQAAFLTFGMAISLFYLLYEKKHRWLHIIIIGVNCYAALLTASRGGLLSIAAIVVCYVITLYDPKTLKTSYKRVFVITLLVIVIGIVMLSLLPSGVSERLFDFDSYEGGNNRDVLWRHGLDILSSPANLFVGAGWGAYKTGGYGGLHNTFLTLLCDTGIIGFLLLLAAPCFFCWKMLKEKKPLAFTVFVAGMAPSFFFEASNKRSFWNAILFVLISYNYFSLTKANKMNQKDESTSITQHDLTQKNKKSKASPIR